MHPSSIPWKKGFQMFLGGRKNVPLRTNGLTAYSKEFIKNWWLGTALNPLFNMKVQFFI